MGIAFVTGWVRRGPVGPYAGSVDEIPPVRVGRVTPASRRDAGSVAATHGRFNRHRRNRRAGSSDASRLRRQGRDVPGRMELQLERTLVSTQLQPSVGLDPDHAMHVAWLRPPGSWSTRTQVRARIGPRPQDPKRVRRNAFPSQGFPPIQTVVRCQVVTAQYNVLTGQRQTFAGCDATLVITTPHETPRLRSTTGGQGYVYRHLITVEIGVECATHQRVQQDRPP